MAKGVLLLFDDRDELEFLSALLTEGGISVYSATSFKKALIVLQTFSPELIVVNLDKGQDDIEKFHLDVKNILQKNILLLNVVNDFTPKAKNKKKDNNILLVSEQPYAKHLSIDKPIRVKVLLSLIRSILNKEDITWFPHLN